MAKAKERILDTALALFNEKGSRNVTTNHIAKACGISTGTLYYHFKNKEAIIRALYDRMGAEWEGDLATLGSLDRSAFEKLKAVSDAVYRRYRFIGNELYALCQNDPILDVLNKERLKLRKTQMRTMLGLLIQTEGYEELEEGVMEFLVDTIWMFAVFWLPYREMVYSMEEGSPMASLDIMLERFLVKKRVDS